MKANEWDAFKPDAGYYGSRVWDFQTVVSDKGWVFVDFPVRYVLGWMDLLNRQDKKAAMPDRDTLMMALDQVLSTNPERNTEGHDLPLPMIWDAVTYIESLLGTIERLKQDNDTLSARCARLNGENNELRKKIDDVVKINELKNEKISSLYDQISLYRRQVQIGKAELKQNAPENCVLTGQIKMEEML